MEIIFLTKQLKIVAHEEYIVQTSLRDLEIRCSAFPIVVYSFFKVYTNAKSKDSNGYAYAQTQHIILRMRPHDPSNVLPPFQITCRFGFFQIHYFCYALRYIFISRYII
jgi:hypothetical protein